VETAASARSPAPRTTSSVTDCAVATSVGIYSNPAIMSLLSRPVVRCNC
jgi:hypothetical protein